MAVTASSTATGLLRISLLLAYCIVVVSLFFITRHFQNQKSSSTFANPRALNVTDLDHVANRGVGKWAKARHGTFISSAVEKEIKKVKASKGKKLKKVDLDVKGTIPKELLSVMADANTNQAEVPVKSTPKADGESKKAPTKETDKEKDNKKDSKAEIKIDEEDDDDEEDFKRDKPPSKSGKPLPPKPSPQQKPQSASAKPTTKEKAVPKATLKAAPKIVPKTAPKAEPNVKYDEDKDEDKEDFQKPKTQPKAKPTTPTPKPQPSTAPIPTGGVQYAFGPPKDTISPDRKKKLPDCLIIGARKAGTRPLLHFLRFHPQIKGVGQEVNFFNNADNFEKGIDWYLDQLPPVRPEMILIEKSAEYFHTREAPKRVWSIKANMKLILVVRDPFERLVSDYHFLQRYAQFTNSTYPFEELSKSLEDLCIDKNTGKLTDYSGLSRSKYGKHTEVWLRYFRRDQLHIVDGDKFRKENPTHELKKVEEFLQVEPFFKEDFFFLNATKGYYCTKSVGCLPEEKGHEHPKFAPDFVHTVRSNFVPFNQRFYDLVGINFGWADSYT